eukprot:1861409-Rhodomonas_salina.2
MTATLAGILSSTTATDILVPPQYAASALEHGVHRVEVDKQANTIRFTVIKRLNWMVSAKR